MGKGKPVIGLTAGRRNHSAPKHEIQTVTIGCAIQNVEAVIRAGGCPVILPRTNDLEVVHSMMRTMDGLILTGGGDVVSLMYNEEPHPANHYEDPVRDRTEMELIELAVSAGTPILAICRGMQILNVALGGTLIQDIPGQVKNSLNHRSRSLESTLIHSVDIEEDSLLADVLGEKTVRVNSFHHQAVKKPGAGLKVNSRSMDGVIEGLEAEDGRPILAVQCHPEISEEAYPVFRKLFDWVVSEASS